MDRQQFVDQLVTEFPELRDDVTDEAWRGLVHLEIACFARYTQAAIDDGERDRVRRCFEFARRVFQHADYGLKNAVIVSYLESLSFHDGRARRSWALAAMPPALKEAWIAINQYMDSLAKRRP